MKTLTTALALGLIGLAGALPLHSFELKGVHALPRGEEVFAYARISPSGRYLVYASAPKDDPRANRALPPRPAKAGQPAPPAAFMSIEILKVVDLATSKVLLDEPGIDGFWSNDDRRLIYTRDPNSKGGEIVIWHRDSGRLQREVGPIELGAYPSWGVRDGRDLILTILNKYFYLDEKGNAILPASEVVECPELGASSERPLLSRDGQRISVFVGDLLMVRNLTDCRNIVNTGLEGAKADLSFDNRYLAFHTPKADPKEGYEIKIVDLKRRTVRTVSGLKGSSLFPSWTRDGRLCFRQEGDSYDGFMMASDVLSLPAHPLPPPPNPWRKNLQWSEIFPETPAPTSQATLVLIWATWNPHSVDALNALQELETELRRSKRDVAIVTATELASRPEEVARFTERHGITLRRIPLLPEHFAFTSAANQIPTTLFFRGDRAVSRRLGAQNVEQLRAWVDQMLKGTR